MCPSDGAVKSVALWLGDVVRLVRDTRCRYGGAGMGFVLSFEW